MAECACILAIAEIIEHAREAHEVYKDACTCGKAKEYNKSLREVSDDKTPYQNSRAIYWQRRDAYYEKRAAYCKQRLGW